MTGPDAGDPKAGRWRVAVLALVFALLAQGCLIAAVSLTRDPF
jgi:hypothetical protein